jgi:hypothetical protein
MFVSESKMTGVLLCLIMFVSESKMTGVLRRLIMFVYILMTG